MKLNNWTKVSLILFFISLSVIGFLVKLPSSFRHVDKELHSLFYFSAAAFLNLIFANRNVIRHIVIFISLYFFGVAIERAQEYSNKFFHTRIHGRYDVEDVQANLKGLVLFSVVWFIIVVILFAYDKLKLVKVKDAQE
jgi:hypothetical protein